MTEEHRKLAVLMFTDIVGYTALAQQDESLALELLAEHNSLLRKSFAAHAGQEIKCTGDGFLVEFESPVQSVQCAMEIQSCCAKRNASVDRKRTFQVRVGIHLGDVVHQGQDVFGDGVNVASRIEPLAEPGGVCISRQVYDQVWNKVPVKLVSLGRKELKNLRAPIEVFRVTSSIEENEMFERDCTRIAVLPLANISPDPSDEYFADGMTEELIYKLSKINDLHVIANTSSMRYKDSDKSVADIGQELKIGSVIEGSVRKAGNRLRITVQLINVGDQEHVWSEHYDREMEDVFAIQSDIAQCVADALEVRLLATERQGIEKKATENLDAYALYLKGCHFSKRKTAADLEKAEKCFRQAIGLDSEYADAHAGLAVNYVRLADGGFSRPKGVYPEVKAAAERALEIDSRNELALVTLAWLRFVQDRDLSAAEEELRQAIELHPSSSEAHRWLGIFLMYSARFDEADVELTRALGLDPLLPLAHMNIGGLRFLAQSYDEAIEAYRRALELDPSFFPAHVGLGNVYLTKGMLEEALAEYTQDATHPPSLTNPMVGWVYAKMGETARARKILDESIEEAKRGYVSATALAVLCLALGKTDECFRYLELAYEEFDPILIFALLSPALEDSVRRDPRFVSLRKKMGLYA